MIQRRTVLKALALLPGLGALRALGETAAPERWRALVSAAAYRVLFEEATERPYSSPLNDEKGQGTYHCAACYAPCLRANSSTTAARAGRASPRPCPRPWAQSETSS